VAATEFRKVALVTGAGRGIGRAIALELARNGFAVSLAARSRDELEETRRLTGLAPKRSLIVLIDLASEDAPDNLLDATLHHFGRLDVLVNNAGWAPPRTPIHKVSAADQDRMIAVNLRAPIALTRLAVPKMVAQRGGTIVNIASAAGRDAPPFEAVYAATKAGLIVFTRACFAELKQSGIKISVIIPGLADTALIPDNKRLEREKMLSPADIAAAVMHVVNASARACPVEIALEPQMNPERGR
jgi:dehydrogenase/reductase SDR family member 4